MLKKDLLYLRLLNNPDWCSFWPAESLLIHVLGMFAADWRTIFSFLFTPPFHVLLCFLPSWLCAVLHEVVLWVSLDGRKSERRVFRWGLLSGKRASSAGRASRGLQDLLFMRRVLLCKSLTVIPLMKWEYIFSCRFIWKCLKKKGSFLLVFFGPVISFLPPVWNLKSDLSDVMLTDDSDLLYWSRGRLLSKHALGVTAGPHFPLS